VAEDELMPEAEAAPVAEVDDDVDAQASAEGELMPEAEAEPEAEQEDDDAELLEEPTHEVVSDQVDND
jgi:hypothetical protein